MEKTVAPGRQNAEKDEIINELNSEQGRTRAVTLFARLMFLMIDEARVHSDEIPAEHLQFNQGKIAAYKQLLDYLTKRLPT
jgi:hypothetical protein